MTIKNHKKTKSKFTAREERIIYEAFMIGRVYTASGEKETPSEIHQILYDKCFLAANRK